MANAGMVGIPCRHCGVSHLFTPSAAAALLVAFQDGDGQRVSGIGTLEPLCLGDVLQNGIPENDPRREVFRGGIAMAWQAPRKGRPRGTTDNVVGVLGIPTDGEAPGRRVAYSDGSGSEEA